MWRRAHVAPGRHMRERGAAFALAWHSLTISFDILVLCSHCGFEFFLLPSAGGYLDSGSYLQLATGGARDGRDAGYEDLYRNSAPNKMMRFIWLAL